MSGQQNHPPPTPTPKNNNKKQKQNKQKKKKKKKKGNRLGIKLEKTIIIIMNVFQECFSM